MTSVAGQEAAVLVFRVADCSFALEASRVAEVVRRPPVTRVPYAPQSLTGVASLRGEVIPVVALGRLLGLEGAAPESGRLIVLEGAQPLGLAVDEVVGLRAGEAQGLVMTEGGVARTVQLESLLEGELASAFRRDKARRPRSAPSAGATTVQSNDVAMLGFVLAGQPYALPLERVREVVAPPPDLVALPRTDEAMIGIASIRGALTPIVSTRVLLGLPGAELDAASRIALVAIGDARVGLAVDRVTAILRAPQSAVGPVPRVLNRGAGEASIAAMLRTAEGGLVSIVEPEQLFREESVAQILQDGRGKAELMSADQEAASFERFVIFTLGEESYGLEITAVEEVVALPETLARLPKAPDYVRGVMNLRGAVVPVIDQRRRFDTPIQDEAARPRVIIVRLGELLAGFAVDGVSQILEIPKAQLSATPELAGEANRMFERAAQIEQDGRIILLVNPRELLQRAERDLLASLTASAGTS